MRCIQTHSRTYKKLIFRCQAAGEPTPSWELFRWISARDVLELSTKTPKNFLDALKNCTSNRCEAKRPGSNAPCGGRSQPSKGRHDFRARSLLSWPKRYNYNRSFFNIFSTEIINFFRYRKPEILSSYYTYWPITKRLRVSHCTVQFDWPIQPMRAKNFKPWSEITRVLLNPWIAS